MDEFLSDIYIMCFKKYVISQNSHVDQLNVEENDDTICIHTKSSEGIITFYPNHIIELTVKNLLKGKIEFYLHFQFKHMKHTLELYNEMMIMIQTILRQPHLRVLLSCSGGLTTGYFAAKLNEAAHLLALDIEFDAISYSHLYEIGEDYDVIMLAPQISYLFSQVSAIFKNKLVLKIPSRVFASYDVKDMMGYIDDERNRRRLTVNQNHQPIPVRHKKHTGKKILCLAFIRNSNRVHILYRLYDGRNRILENNEIIKPTLKVEDLYDVIDSELAQYPDIGMIGMAVPGIIHMDYINSISIDGMEILDLKHDLMARYKQEFVFGNDVNVMALGYYSLQDQYESLSLIFQPICALSGLGNIVNGKLLVGKHYVAGEIQFLPLNYTDHPLILHANPKGAIEAMAKSIASIISMLDPELIVICCYMITDMDELMKEVYKYIPREYVPPIEQVDYLQEYMLLGTLMLCHEAC